MMPAPITLGKGDDPEFWELSLEEAVKMTLANSKVLRDLGGLESDFSQAHDKIAFTEIEQIDFEKIQVDSTGIKTIRNVCTYPMKFQFSGFKTNT